MTSVIALCLGLVAGSLLMTAWLCSTLAAKIALLTHELDAHRHSLGDAEIVAEARLRYLEEESMDVSTRVDSLYRKLGYSPHPEDRV